MSKTWKEQLNEIIKDKDDVRAALELFLKEKLIKKIDDKWTA